jgi:small acid-soluble spore protein I (minor)
MSFDLRSAVLQNVKGNSQEELRGVIEDSIQSQEEKTLPGLGVLFEVIWKNSDAAHQNDMLQTLSNHLG